MSDRTKTASSVSFEIDIDENMDTADVEEDRVEFIKRSIIVAKEKKMRINISCWIETQRKLK